MCLEATTILTQRDWGKFHITFLDPSFPSRWQAKWSYCDKAPKENWEGTPIVGN
jgi:hypothetical protein